MNTKTYKIIAMIISLAIILGMAPLTATATEPEPMITDVWINPIGIGWGRGVAGTFQFTATVNVQDDPLNTLDTSVTWSLSGNDVPETTISNAGLITIAANETSDLIIVTATSNGNPLISSTADVTFVVIIVVTFNGNGGLPTNYFVSFSSEMTLGEVAPTVTRANHNFAGWWTTPVTGGVQKEYDFALTEATTLYARWIPRDNDQGGGVGGGSGGGGGGGGSAPAAPPANAPQAVTGAAANTAVNNAVTAARAAGETVAAANLRNPGEISHATLGMMANAAAEAGMTLRLQADSLTPTGGVDVRITLNPALERRNLNLSASTQNAQAQATARFIERFFSNDVMTVSLGQQAPFSQDVRIAARLTQSLNTNNLVIYVFDREANRLAQIPSANVRIDANGYVHFSTRFGGDIIISDGPLTRR